jgi:hypothetical protein
MNVHLDDRLRRGIFSQSVRTTAFRLHSHTIGFRNSLQRFSSRITMSRGKIAKGHNARQSFLAIQNRQTMSVLSSGPDQF